MSFVATPLLEECEDDTHTPEMRTWESRRTPKISELDCRGKNTLHWGFFYIIGKLWKCRCRKWACMGHLDICSTSYVPKKGRESNWQFDSRPVKLRNWPDPGVCKGSATHRWKALKESYNVSLDLILIRGLIKDLWPCEVSGVHFGTISGQFWDSTLGVPGQKGIQMWVRWNNAKNTIWGKVVGSPESGPWWVKWVNWIRVARDLSQHQKWFRRCTNPLVGSFLMQDQVTK
jgi:hypothetical protein